MTILSDAKIAVGDIPSEQLYRKVSWRVIPLLMACYFFACLDRQNISFAKLQMQVDLSISDAVYGLGAGIFFIGYVLFEIPSNLLLPSVGARKTIARILILWGLTSAAMMFVNSIGMFYCLRFLLGVFEAGFAPGMIFYLTYWYGEARMARALALVLMAGPISGVLGGPLSAWLMTACDGMMGISGWQWMFFFEGIPCVVLGFVVWKVLADRPDTAKWLSPNEKALLETHTRQPGAKHHSFKHVLGDPRIYVMAGAYFCLICGIYTVNFWLPSILKANGVSNTMHIGLLTSIPYLGAIASMFLVGKSSDKHQERRWHSAVPAVVAAICLGVATYLSGSIVASVLFMIVATMMMYAAYTVFWSIPSKYLKGDVAAGGIALVNTIGLLGGFFSPTIIGWATSVTGSLHAGLYVMVGLLAVGALLLSLIKLPSLSK
ncbi:Putative metabolite transport protein NicT [Pseudomonas fluorescens]|uniref:MFS transporter n=1 Tax=Pseudomonas fluorescens TaxID=294 RepID=UPI001254AE34|nr:MFS transporter [Pseudomonas fluorescens]VVO54155.1 Putative metabolite transport protein NicT [Pseudomonas fluorescens]